jgi:hypothetical protein
MGPCPTRLTRGAQVGARFAPVGPAARQQPVLTAPGSGIRHHLHHNDRRVRPPARCRSPSFKFLCRRPKLRPVKLDGPMTIGYGNDAIETALRHLCRPASASHIEKIAIANGTNWFRDDRRNGARSHRTGAGTRQPCISRFDTPDDGRRNHLFVPMFGTVLSVSI